MTRGSIIDYKIFVSHGSHDMWLASQIAKEISISGATPFLDETNIPKGSPNFKQIIRTEISMSREMVALFTPWSAIRSWVWIEMGAAWDREIPILAVFYGMIVNDLDKTGQGKAILEDINIINLNDFDAYLRQMATRVAEAQK
ncbi:MAG: toll/interleukin-1 receptor domain-containing protein [Methylococcales bacterium]